MCEWAFIPRKSERCRHESSRAALGDTCGRQRVGEGDEHLWRLFLKGDFAWQIRNGRQDNFAWAAGKEREEISVLGEVEAAVASHKLDLRWRAETWRNTNSLCLLTR
jgi:hypothetical protein